MNYELRFTGRREGVDESFPVTVPGNIQKDFAAVNNFGDWQFGTGCTKFDEIEDCIWIYSASFDYHPNGERVFFVTDGIDYQCECFIGDKKFFEHEGMFEGFECDITDLLCEGENILNIRILPPPKSYESPRNRGQADRSVKPPASYGWDWHPRLIPSGLWQGASIVSRKDSDFSKPQLSYELEDDYSSVTVNICVDCKAPVKYTLKDREGVTVAQSDNGMLTLKDPILWWCRGQGDQYLYTWEAASETCVQSGKIGFRRIELHMNPGTWSEPSVFPKSRSHPPITITLNGREIFAKGSNFVEADVFTGNVSAEYYRELVDLAVKANMNIFRMWGGAGIQKQSFYDACDEMGMMIWQEFPLACNNYRNYEDYLAVLETEARAIVRQLRYHPCIVLWCGGNELFNGWSGMTDQHYALRLLDKICYEENRSVPFIFTSPLDGMAHGNYVFWSQNDGEVYQLFNNAHYTAYTEFGVGAISPYEVLKEIIPEDELAMPTRTQSWELHHGFGAWGVTRWTCLDILERYFGKMTSTEQCCRYASWLQCEGYKAIFEEARRQKPYCSMAINWCYNEPWKTAGGNSLLNYPTRKKPSYYAVQNSLRDIMASARIQKFTYRSDEKFTADIWLLNDLNAPVSEDISVYIQIGGEKHFVLDWKGADAEPMQNKEGPMIKYVLPYVENIESFDLILETKNHGETRYTLQYIPFRRGSKPKVLNM